MASSTRINGFVELSTTSSGRTPVFSGAWCVEYDWTSDRVTSTDQPRRVRALGFPPPFDRDLAGTLMGQGKKFSRHLYLFKGGQYLRLDRATLQPNQEAKDIAGPWSLPGDWTSVDAVTVGGGDKSGFAYFFRGARYCRFDWSTDSRSPGYPKVIAGATEFNTPAPFTADFDGAVVGLGGWRTKLYLFKTIAASVDAHGNPAQAGSPGSHLVRAPAYVRYDFDQRRRESVVENPADVVRNWHGLFPLLDAGAATDLALTWCSAAVTAILRKASGVADPLIDGALRHHFMTSTPSSTQLQTLQRRMGDVHTRLSAIPIGFRWTPGLVVAAQSTGSLTEVGDDFSLLHGPNGRAAVLIHEAVHFTHPGGPAVDIPEWSGATINGIPHGILQGGPWSGRAYSSLTTDEALTNPSSYAAFAQEIALRADERFGGGRPHE